MFKALVILLVLVAAVFGAYQYWWLPQQAPDSELDKAVSTLVGFGKVLKMVPLASEPEAVRAAMRLHYKPYLTRELLSEWQQDPERAPGRRTSSPWPDGIEPQTVSQENGSFVIRGDVLEITSEELVNGGAANRYPVVATLVEQDGRWVISAFEADR